MSEVITIPKKLVQKDDLVILPRKDYEEFLRLRLRREWEEKDTNEAIRIFNEERKKKKLKILKSLADLV